VFLTLFYLTLLRRRRDFTEQLREYNNRFPRGPVGNVGMPSMRRNSFSEGDNLLNNDQLSGDGAEPARGENFFKLFV
jgi:hypothetical protein